MMISVKGILTMPTSFPLAAWFAITAAGIGFWSTPALVSDDRAFPPPDGRVILELTGDIEQSNAVDSDGNAVLRLDRDLLMSLPQRTITTYTDWTEGEQTFSGVPLAELLDAAQAEGTQLRAVARNDYETFIPMSDLADFDILMAHSHNGSSMRVRDKGPIWILYPSESPSAARVNPNNPKMIWQLKRLDILD